MSKAIHFVFACVLQFAKARRQKISMCHDSESISLPLATYILTHSPAGESKKKWKMNTKTRRIREKSKILTFLISEIFVNCLPNSHKSTPNFSAQFRTLWRKKRDESERGKRKENFYENWNINQVIWISFFSGEKEREQQNLRFFIWRISHSFVVDVGGCMSVMLVLLI